MAHMHSLGGLLLLVAFTLLFAQLSAVSTLKPPPSKAPPPAASKKPPPAASPNPPPSVAKKPPPAAVKQPPPTKQPVSSPSNLPFCLRPSNSTQWLTDNERIKGGHIQLCHVHNEAWLIQRTYMNMPGCKMASTASAWPDNQTAVSAITQAIGQNLNEYANLVAWFAKAKNDDRIQADGLDFFPKAEGVSIRKGGSGGKVCATNAAYKCTAYNSATTVLVAKVNSRTGAKDCFVLTAYPNYVRP